MTQHVTEILTDTEAVARIRGALSEESEINSGINQTDGLSPMCFRIAMVKVIRTIEIRIKRRDADIKDIWGGERDV